MHQRHWRAYASPRNEGINRRGVALHKRLDAAVRPVAHPSGHAARVGFASHRLAVANPLYSTRDPKKARHHVKNVGGMRMLAL